MESLAGVFAPFGPFITNWLWSPCAIQSRGVLVAVQAIFQLPRTHTTF
jgi:hypothetical protein